MKYFEIQLRKTLEEMRNLDATWDANKVKSYPKYLPSFNEFIADFWFLLQTKDEKDNSFELRDKVNMMVIKILLEKLE